MEERLGNIMLTERRHPPPPTPALRRVCTSCQVAFEDKLTGVVHPDAFSYNFP